MSHKWVLSGWFCLLTWGFDYASEVPLLKPSRHQVTVHNVAELTAAINGAKPGSTIMLSDGTYDLASVEPLRIRADSVTLYGKSRDPAKAVLKGGGFGSPNVDEEMIKIEATHATLAYLTLRDVRANALKLQTGPNHDLLVHNVHFLDICERSIKSTDIGTARNGTVRYCLFEQITPITASIPNLHFNGDYIAGMDMMRIDGWHIHDNVFKNIRGRHGGGRAAVFLWRGCRNVTVERNLFIGCDRAVSFGNPSSNMSDMEGGVIRNNFIVAGAGSAIEMCNTLSSLVAHNTVFSANPSHRRTVFFYHGGVGNALQNNLVLGNLFSEGGAAPASAANLFLSTPGSGGGWFSDAASGDLHLGASALAAIDRGARVPGVPADFDGDRRDDKPDIGADEFRKPDAKNGTRKPPGASK